MTMRVHSSLIVPGIAIILGLQSIGAADDVKKSDPRVEAGKSKGADATFLRRESPDKPWQVVRENEALNTGDLLISGTQGSLISANGAVKLSTMASMTGIKEFPIHETAIILHEAKDVDLDFTLDRGRVEIENVKKSGAAHVRIHVGTHVAVITFPEPGDRMVDEVFGRWGRGVHFKKNPKPEDVPDIAVLALALKGDIEIKGTHHVVDLKAPPGPALLVLNHFGDHSVPVPEHVKEVPAWAKDGGQPEEDEKRLAVAKKFRELLMKKPVSEAVSDLAKSDSIDAQRTAIFIMGALDDLESLCKTMESTKNQEVFDAGVVALRHWIGRCPGQDQKLYKGAIEKGKLTPAQAETVLDLLHSYGEADLDKPETYEMLISYLKSDHLAIRGLAYWHLERLVPDGKKIGYSPLASKEQRDKAIHAWQELLPEGTLPAPPKGEGSK
jgi:hypothetical protein